MWTSHTKSLHADVNSLHSYRISPTEIHVHLWVSYMHLYIIALYGCTLFQYSAVRRSEFLVLRVVLSYTESCCLTDVG